MTASRGARGRSRLTWLIAGVVCLVLGIGAALLAALSLPAALGLVVVSAGVAALATRNALLNPASPAAREAHALAERRSTVVAAASHEIRNPLTMVAASAKLLEDESSGLSDQQRTFLGVVRQQTDHAISIADDLLIQSRIDAGKFSINRTPTDLLALVRAVVEAMKPIAAHRNQVLVTDLPQYMPHMRVDPRAVRQALSNLLMNAVRHTAEGRMITTRLRDNSTSIVLMVLDDGDGMSKDERRRLFEPFESGDLLGDGTGLGLNITRQLVEAHGGRILIDTRLREGTAIMITLPRDAA
jgi:two-component system, OmpR family, sensor kinase